MVTISRLRFAAMVILVALVLTGCGTQNGYRKVSLHNRLDGTGLTAQDSGGPSSGQSGAEKSPTLRVAIANVYSPKATLQNYQPLLDYLGQELGRPTEMVQRNTYAEVNDLIRSGNVDLAFVCTYAYVEGQQEFGMQAIAAPVVHNEDRYYSYIIVPADSSARSMADLRGRTFAFTDPLSNTGRLAPEALLREMGETPEGFFKKTIFTYSHDRSIQAVADHLVDGAAVDSLVYDFAIRGDPKLKAATRVIYRSEPFGTPPVVVNPKLDPALKQQLTQALLNMDQDPQGKRILASLMIDAFIQPDDKSYDPVRRMAQQVHLP
ncbi:MAG: substrate-binding domain-containing protein [Symbiobacteriia bacterium]